MKKCILLILFTILFNNNFAIAKNFLQAYDSLHATVVATYPMGKWKAIKWDSLNLAVRDEVEKAMIKNDTLAFYTTIQEYAAALHDGHVNVRNGWSEIRKAAMKKEIGGCYGFSTTQLDNGNILVSRILSDSPAEKAEIQVGAQIIKVNDIPVEQYIKNVRTIWSEILPSTNEAKRLNQCRFIGRASIGDSIKITYQNPKSQAPATTKLMAVDDNFELLNITSMRPIFEPGNDVTSQIIEPDNIGYIRLTSVYGDSLTIKKLYTDFKNAILNFNNKQVGGLILDLRSNIGGYDALGAALIGFFYSDTVFYEYQSWFNPETSSLELIPIPVQRFNPETLELEPITTFPKGSLYIEPPKLHFDKPFIIMVGPKNISSGEGIPMMLKKLPNCKVVSFYGTNGSFGIVGYEHYLFPGENDFYFRYPFGVSLDKNFNIQIDADSTGNGGVTPNSRVPMNETTFNQLYLDNIDVELEYAKGVLKQIVDVEEPLVNNSQNIILSIAPNPFSDKTTVAFDLLNDSHLILEIVDILGRTVQKIIDNRVSAGFQKIEINTSELPKGSYFIKMKKDKEIYINRCLKY